MICNDAIAEYLRPLLPPKAKALILGVGSELRCDDFAGMYTAKLIAPLADSKRLAVVEGSTAPENCVGVIRKFAPDAVIVIDAAHMGLEVGEFAILDPSAITGLTFSTHMLPLPVTLSYIEATCDCVTAYVGIEPASTAQGIGMDARVISGARRVAEIFGRLISGASQGASEQ